jgi:flavin reductase (DIM6/NTAB) family NADH-FMN oxidoreductase RutF
MSVDAIALDPARFRELFRRHAAGVVVITLDAGAGPAGFTATSFASVSLHPPLAVFAISTTASTWPQVRSASSVVVNLLGSDGADTAIRFATSGIDRFAEPTRWRRLPTGEPVLDEAAHWLRARVTELIPVGDHVLAVVAVDEISVGPDVPALAYHRGAYHPVGSRA